MSILQDLINGKETSELIVIQDSIQHNGRALIRCLTNSLAKRVDGIHVFCFDSAPASFICGFEPAVSNKIHSQDCWSHPLSWYNSAAVNGSSQEVTIHLDFLKVIQKQLGQLGGGPKPLAVIVDSLSPLLTHRPLPVVCRMLHQLIYNNNQELPGCEVVQVVCLVHGDLHDHGVRAPLAHLASTHIALSPNVSIAPITQEPFGFCFTVHKKRSGKIIEKKEGYSIDENYQLITFGEVANKQVGILQPAVDMQPSADPTANLTFNLSLSEAERQTKNNLVLPFQVHLKPTAAGRPVGGGGEGGMAKIYYQPDQADDFDDEDPDDDLNI